jgi:transposase InsO family protein
VDIGDITYVRTWPGWLYLATMLDVFSRRVIGWALTHLWAELVCDALRMALATRGGPVAGVIFHSGAASTRRPSSGASRRCVSTPMGATDALGHASREPEPPWAKLCSAGGG